VVVGQALDDPLAVSVGMAVCAEFIAERSLSYLAFKKA